MEDGAARPGRELHDDQTQILGTQLFTRLDVIRFEARRHPTNPGTDLAN